MYCASTWSLTPTTKIKNYPKKFSADIKAIYKFRNKHSFYEYCTCIWNNSNTHLPQYSYKLITTMIPQPRIYYILFVYKHSWRRSIYVAKNARAKPNTKMFGYFRFFLYRNLSLSIMSCIMSNIWKFSIIKHFHDVIKSFW